MEFLNPTALLGFAALPLLLIPYLIRRRPRRMIFSSLMLFNTGAEQTTRRPWGRPHLPPIFFLQLILLALLILALGEPVLSVRPTRMAIILDNSASMQTLEDGRSRFASAQDRARDLLNDVGIAGTADIYLTAPRLEKVNTKPLAPAEAGSVLTALSPYDIGNPPVDYDLAMKQLASENKYDRIYLITDHPARGQSPVARVITVGVPKGNLAVMAFDVSRSSLADARLQANVQLANFSNQDEKVRISIKAGDIVLAARAIAVGAGRTASISFEGLPEHSYYIAEIDRRDVLALDNRRYAALAAWRELKILAVTPRPQAAVSLRAIPGVSVDAVSPADYEKTARAGYGLEIFQFAAPAALPQNPALFILPPENNPLVRLGRPVANAEVSGWREPHALTRYINFSLLRPAYARPLAAQITGEAVLETTGGALAISHEVGSTRFLTLGFDPLPYLGRSNLPMSIFTLNLFDWFLAAGGQSQAAGEPIALGAVRAGDFLVTPKGEKIALSGERNVFAGTYRQGIYQLSRSGTSQWFARNLNDAHESDLRSPPVIELKGASSSGAGASVLFSFWPYLLMASLFLLLIEWFLSPRAKTAPAWHGPQQAGWKP